tara:strand:- start:543 stop:740 length:198 start_codon:yes stop_codon:yes gene_type:complete
MPFSFYTFSEQAISDGALFTSESWRNINITGTETWSNFTPSGTESWATFTPSGTVEVWKEVTTGL